MTRATELPLQIYFVSRRSPFIDIVIVYNQDDFVAGCSIIVMASAFGFIFILGLHFRFDGDQLTARKLKLEARGAKFCSRPLADRPMALKESTSRRFPSRKIADTVFLPRDSDRVLTTPP